MAITINVVGQYDDRDIKKAIADLKNLQGAAGTASTSMADKFASIGKSMESVGKKMTAGLTLPIVGAGAMAVKFASDLAESTSKAEVVFGNQADAVKKFASNAASAMGMSSQQALEAAGTYGNLFRSMGIGTEQSSKMSTTMVKLASDLASFNNASPEEALLALKSGLTGETEPLKRFGINLNEARLKAEAMALGLSDGKGALDANAKAQAAYSLIMKDSVLAQGDFERTSGGLANQMRIIKAKLTDTGAQIAKAFLPIIQKAAQFISDLVSKFQTLSPGAQKIIVIVLAIAAALGPLLWILGSVTAAVAGLNLAFLASPIFWIIAGIVALVAIFVIAYKKVEGFRKIIDIVFNAFKDIVLIVWKNIIKPVFNELVRFFTDTIQPALQKLAAKWRQVWPVIAVLLQKAWEKMKPVVEKVAHFIGVFLVQYLRITFKVWTEVFKAIAKVVVWLWNVLEPVFVFLAKAIMNYVVPALIWLWNAGKTAFEAIAKVATWLWQNVLQPVFKFIGNVIMNYVVPYIKMLWQIWSTIFQAIATVIGWVWNNVLSPIFSFIGQIITGIIIPIFVTLGAIFGLIWQGIAAAATWVWENVLKPVWDQIVSVLNTVLMPVLNVLGQVFKAVWNGIVSAVQWAWGVMSGVFNTIKGGFEGVVGFFSDKVGQIIGVFSGVADGIGNAFARAFRSIREWWNNTIGGRGFTMPDFLGGAEFRIPTLARGGVIPGIPGTPVPAIVHAGEMVVRRTQVNGYQQDQARNGDVNVYVNSTDANPYEIGRELLWALKVAG